MYLGYGYVAEYGNVTVWDRLLENAEFSQAVVHQFKPTFKPIQNWWNYKRTYSATYSNEKLSQLIGKLLLFILYKMDMILVQSVPTYLWNLFQVHI